MFWGVAINPTVLLGGSRYTKLQRTLFWVVINLRRSVLGCSTLSPRETKSCVPLSLGGKLNPRHTKYQKVRPRVPSRYRRLYTKPEGYKKLCSTELRG